MMPAPMRTTSVFSSRQLRHGEIDFLVHWRGPTVGSTCWAEILVVTCFWSSSREARRESGDPPFTSPNCAPHHAPAQQRTGHTSPRLCCDKGNFAGRTGDRNAARRPVGTGRPRRRLPAADAVGFGPDPDGEGEALATLVRYAPGARIGATAGAVLYVHGFTDYFFQEHLAEHFAAKGYQFYALDLRKCGRSLRDGQTPHYVTDLALY